MPLSNLDHKKLYYYVICVMAFFVLMWGAIDLSGSAIGLLSLRSNAASLGQQGDGDMPIAPIEKGDQFFDSFYQKKMLTDRLWDSMARVLIAGSIFVYCRKKIDVLEA
jgi:hypothetical protein